MNLKYTFLMLFFFSTLASSVAWAQPPGGGLPAAHGPEYDNWINQNHYGPGLVVELHATADYDLVPDNFMQSIVTLESNASPPNDWSYVYWPGAIGNLEIQPAMGLHVSHSVTLFSGEFPLALHDSSLVQDAVVTAASCERLMAKNLGGGEYEVKVRVRADNAEIVPIGAQVFVKDSTTGFFEPMGTLNTNAGCSFASTALTDNFFSGVPTKTDAIGDYFEISVNMINASTGADLGIQITGLKAYVE